MREMRVDNGQWRVVHFTKEGADEWMVVTGMGRTVALSNTNDTRQAEAEMREIASNHNQHAALVAEREKLRRMLTNVIDANYGTGYHHIGDGDGMPEAEAKEIADWWKAELERIQREYNSALATGEQYCANCKAIIDAEADHRISADESTTGKEVWLCEVCAIA